MVVFAAAAEKDKLASGRRRRRRRSLLLLLLGSRDRCPLRGQSVQPAPAALPQGPAVRLRGHGERALGLEEGQQLEPERLERGGGFRVFFSNVSERRLRRKRELSKKTPFPLSLSFSLTCAPARSPARSACSAPNSSARRRSPLAASAAAAAEAAEEEEGETSIGVVA